MPAWYAFLASIFCLFSFSVYFLSDLCFAEVLFSLSTMLFFLSNRKEVTAGRTAASYFFAVAAFALRSIGLAIFIAWVIESLVRKKFKQAILRLALVLIPVVCWQLYIVSVEASQQYNHPAYSYQRDAYMFYNVTYSRNISLEDPFAPEKGKADFVRRVFNNGIRIPGKMGESLLGTVFWRDQLLEPLHWTKITPKLLAKLDGILLFILGLMIMVGLVVVFLKKQSIILVYLVFYVAAMCLTPFAEHFPRYLMPVMPFFALGLIGFLLALKSAVVRNFTTKAQRTSGYLINAVIMAALLCQALTFTFIHMVDDEPIQYVDRHNNLLRYRMYFSKTFTTFNLCMQYIRQHADASDVVAAGTPHWIYLQTGLKSVMPPFNPDYAGAQREMETVPVKYLVIGKDAVGSERYSLPVVKNFARRWKKVYSTPANDWAVYQQLTND